ncbi:rod shape-determining protein RodA [Bacillus sp. UMB0899]|nr:rod shape-determining protein RodA [Bacillus sp. UMB0899]
MFAKERSYFDYTLVFFIFLIMICSCVAISSAEKYAQYSENFMMKQLIWFVLGAVIAAFIFLFDSEQIQKITPYLYGLGVVLLLGILIAPESIAPVRNGAKSWFIVPGIGSIQPSEYMKIFLILMLSSIIQKHDENTMNHHIKQDLFLLVKIAVVALIPIFLVLKQNDFGSSLVMLVITSGIVFASDINWRIILSFIGMAVCGVGLLVVLFIFHPEFLLKFFGEYQLNRIYSWLDPFGNSQDIGYQLNQSLLAIGSGMLDGKGYQNSEVYIPEAHSDFIFTIVSEEFGFLGASVVVSLYFLLVYRLIVIAIYSRGDLFNTLICIGVATLFTFHVFQNIGMVSGLLPITGIPLLLLSYGGSSVMSCMIALGLVLNISLKKKDYLFSNDD